MIIIAVMISAIKLMITITALIVIIPTIMKVRLTTGLPICNKRKDTNNNHNSNKTAT